MKYLVLSISLSLIFLSFSCKADGSQTQSEAVSAIDSFVNPKPLEGKGQIRAEREYETIIQPRFGTDGGCIESGAIEGTIKIGERVIAYTGEVWFFFITPGISTESDFYPEYSGYIDIDGDKSKRYWIKRNLVSVNRTAVAELLFFRGDNEKPSMYVIDDGSIMYNVKTDMHHFEFGCSIGDESGYFSGKVYYP